MQMKTSPEEAVVLGFLTIAVTTVGVAAVAASSLDVRGRGIPADPVLAVMAGIGAIAAFAACVFFAVRGFGAKNGLKLVFSNLAASLIVAGAGALVGFLLRVVFGPAAFVMLLLLWAVGIYTTFWFKRKAG